MSSIAVYPPTPIIWKSILFRRSLLYLFIWWQLQCGGLSGEKEKVLKQERTDVPRCPENSWWRCHHICGPNFTVNVISALILRGSRHTIVFLEHCPQTPGMSDILSDGSQAQNWFHSNLKTLFSFLIVLKYVLMM